MNEAAMEALEDRLGSGLGESIELSHFERALSKVKPSVSEQVQADILIGILSFCLALLYAAAYMPYILFLLITAKETLRSLVEEILCKLIQHHASTLIDLSICGWEPATKHTAPY